MQINGEYDLMDALVDNFLRSPEGVAHMDYLAQKKAELEPLRKIGSYANTLGMSHGGTHRFAGALPQVLLEKAAILWPQERLKDIHDLLFARYKVFHVN
jgi:hypothetical protein